MDDNNLNTLQQTTSDAQEEKAFAALDSAKIKDEIAKDVEERAKEIAEKQVEARMREMASRMVGVDDKKYSWEKRGDGNPKDWNEVIDESATAAEERILAKIEAREKKRQEEAEKAKETNYQKERALIDQWDREIETMMELGDIPSYGDDVKEMIQKRINIPREKFDTDPGLRARKEIFNLSSQYGVSPAIAHRKYVAQKPQGSRAPVFGAGVSNTVDAEEFSYEDIVEARKMLS